MAQAGKIYPAAGEYNSAPPRRGSYHKVKEQHLPGPATYKRSRHERSCCCCLLTWLCSILAVFVILVGIAILVFWLVVQPRAPRFQLQNVHISGLNTTSSTINTNITFEIMARNPNKHLGIYYDSIAVNVEANGVTVGDGSIPSFYQGHKNTTYATGDLSSEGVILNSDTEVLLTSNGTNVPLYAKVDVKARVKVGSVKSSTINLKVRCNFNVDLTRSSGSQLTHNQCKVKW